MVKLRETSAVSRWGRGFCVIRMVPLERPHMDVHSDDNDTTAQHSESLCFPPCPQWPSQRGEVGFMCFGVYIPSRVKKGLN